jgi:hypothetical protein
MIFYPMKMLLKAHLKFGRLSPFEITGAKSTLRFGFNAMHILGFWTRWRNWSPWAIGNSITCYCNLDFGFSEGIPDCVIDLYDVLQGIRDV